MIRKIRKIIDFLLAIVSFLFFIFVWQAIYVSKDYDTSDKLFLIEKGQSLSQISKNLEEQGLIKDNFLFDCYIYMKTNQGNLQAGEHILRSSMSISKIAEAIVSGETIKEAIVIPEGWNLRDVGWYFENKGMFQAEELFELVGFPVAENSSFLFQDITGYDFLQDKPNNVGLEGYLFPDSYRINKGDSLEIIVGKMLNHFDKKLTKELRMEIENQGKTIFETVTMASLLEKEVRTVEDKKIVAGILWKRLKNKIPLQVDATIVYITGKKTTNVSKTETRINSPYNTYLHLGLPLGPICNPGIESLKSALYYEKSDYWYYLSTPEGETIFSKNLKEHNIAKVKYLK